jgi:hypothetical protein
MNINFFLKEPNKTQTSIFFGVQSSFTQKNESGKIVYKRIKRSTGITIKSRFWNQNAQKARENFEDHSAINLRWFGK